MIKKAFLSFLILTCLVGYQGFASKKGNKSTGPATLSSLSGVVFDKSSNEKLAGVMIRLTDTDQKIYSDTKGEFSLEGITPGTYKVKVNCISYKDKEVTVTISRSSQQKLEIQLNPIEP